MVGDEMHRLLDESSIDALVDGGKVQGDGEGAQ